MSHALNASDLHRLRVLLDRLPAARFRLQRTLSAATKCTASMSGSGGGGGVGDPTGDGALRVDLARTALTEIEQEIALLREKLAPLLSALDQPLMHQVMTLRYMDGFTVRQIACCVAYSESHVFYLIRKAEEIVCNM